MATLLDNGNNVVHPHQLSQRRLADAALSAPPIPYSPPTAEAWWETLSQFASQHHRSEYSRIKFGPRGCCTQYVPLCVHAPEVYDELQRRQMGYFNDQVWWLSNTRDERPSLVVSSETLGAESTLVHELSSAMGESLPQATDSQGEHILKTSATHPINVSSIIPFDSLALISSHVLLASCRPGCTTCDPSFPECDSSPTICEIAPSFTLDRLIFADYSFSSAPSTAEITSTGRPLRPTSPSAHLRTRSHVSQALQAAMNSGLHSSGLPGIGNLSLNMTHTPSDIIVDKDSTASTTIHSNHSSVSLSLSLTLTTPTPKPSYCLDVPSSPLSAPDHSFHDPLYMHQPAPNVIVPSDSTLKSSSTFTLGNLFLSSCPGKKVRLQGPVKGRSGVCRDLETDLRRMKEMGVGCIVCCLDDTELEFLGAPWTQYQSLAHKIGLDVMRLPTPEGLAPSLSSETLNEHLTTLIHEYTLYGTPVLVHCRGGVGRAGVVACCWMIRLGLFGSLSDLGPPCVNGDGTYYSDMKTLEVVRKAIEVIRRRRSMKAIETYEQVKFLVDYVNYLRTSFIS